MSKDHVVMRNIDGALRQESIRLSKEDAIRHMKTDRKIGITDNVLCKIVEE